MYSKIMAEKDDIVLSFGDSLLRKSDLDLLMEPNWINDKIITFCFEYYEKEQFNHSADRIALISPSIAQLMRFATVEDLAVLLEPLHLPSKQYVFVAINDNADPSQVGGTHWSLMVYVKSKQEFQHFDALKGSNQAIARKFVDKLQPFVQAPRGKLKFIEMDCPQQTNSFDCGMYLIAMTEHLIKEFCECFSVSLTEVVNQDSIQRKRKQVTDLIHELAATDSIEHHLS
ncbi:sentrin-specific protease 8-like [Physella acuta]|uniref:sentrin-specific protease 8-like n=1 Tax=Physella acuta TaxID=109671 RepID=UPI0027DE24D8|nr:sentrin-specific protease 8-like [Physella acuta]